ncbi:MAG: hypothetical protein V4466_03190 [Pseudomonadota bacterium]
MPGLAAPTPIADTLFLAAFEQARAAGYRLGDGAEHQFRYAADQAAAQIEAAGSEEAAGAMLEHARRSFATMIATMIEGAETIEGYRAAQPGTIGEVTFTHAMGKLCPLWPFC